MPQFVLMYVGGNPPETPEEGQRNFARYKQWLDDLGDVAVSPGNPLMNTRTVHPQGHVTEGSQTTASGYTIVECEDMEAALTIAQACPFLDTGGALEVSQLGKMPG